MNESPLVSILMTAYNRADYIGQAIESVLTSTYSNFELIISDDCSTDATVEIARRYEATDNRIAVYVNKKNLGDYPNRNYISQYAAGKYLFVLDSDDYIFPDSIADCLNWLNKYPETEFAVFNVAKLELPLPLSPGIAIRHHFFKQPFLTVGPGGTIITRKLFNEVGGYPEKYGPANDMYFNLKVASQHNLTLIPFPFFFYRRHPNQQIENKAAYLYNNYLYLRDALNELNLPLNKKEIIWLKKKNSRRFIVNVVKSVIKTKRLKEALNALKITRFSAEDFFEGIFN